MANGINRVILIGNLGKNPEVRSFESGKNVRFTLATNEDYKSKSGEKVSHTEWHNISIWRGLADVAEKYLKKGDKIYLEGRIRYRSYEQDGVRKFFTEIDVDNMIMLDKVATDSQNASPQNRAADEPSVPANDQIFVPNTAEDDDLPF